MKKMSLLQWLLVVPALVLLLVSVVFTVFVLSFAPPIVSVVAWVVFGVFALWLVLVRGRRSAGEVSEAGLMGRQTSKDGLL